MKNKYFYFISILLFCAISCGNVNNFDAPATILSTGNTVFEFESDVESWISENSMMYVTHNDSHGADPATDDLILSGNGSLKGTCNISGYDMDSARVVLRYTYNNPVDLSGATFSFNIHPPAGNDLFSKGYIASLWLGRMNYTTYTYEWNLIENISGSKNYSSSSALKNWYTFTVSPVDQGEDSVLAVALQISKDTGTEDNWSGDIYFDHFTW